MMHKSLFAVALVALTSCLNSAAPRNTLTYDFNMNVAGEGWIEGASDFDVGREADVDVVTDLLPLPSPLPAELLGRYLAGTNISDDVFLFIKKRFDGLAPNTTYRVAMAVEIVSDIHADCTVGTGPLVWIKAGALGTEPAVVDQGGRWVMNIDKGDQDTKGQFLQLGDIRNDLSGCPSPGTFDAKGSTLQQQEMELITDDSGGFWIFLGTESGFESRHEVYFTGFRIQVTLVP
jgi:hypothetical protein